MQGKSWDLRWCVLTSSSLTYYRSLEDRDWGGAGTVLSLSSLKRFESISSLVFQVPSCRLPRCTACTCLSERSVSCCSCTSISESYSSKLLKSKKHRDGPSASIQLSCSKRNLQLTVPNCPSSLLRPQQLQAAVLHPHPDTNQQVQLVTASS